MQVHKVIVSMILMISCLLGNLQAMQRNIPSQCQRYITKKETESYRHDYSDDLTYEELLDAKEFLGPHLRKELEEHLLGILNELKDEHCDLLDDSILSKHFQKSRTIQLIISNTDQECIKLFNKFVQEDCSLPVNLETLLKVKLLFVEINRTIKTWQATLVRDNHKERKLCISLPPALVLDSKYSSPVVNSPNLQDSLNTTPQLMSPNRPIAKDGVSVFNSPSGFGDSI